MPGTTASVQDTAGYQWKVGVCGLKLVSEIKSSNYFGSNNQVIAPPGQAVITLVLQVTNEATDRPEPFPNDGVFDVIDWATSYKDLQMWVPAADCSNFHDLQCGSTSVGGQASIGEGHLRIADGVPPYERQISTTLYDPIPAAGTADFLLYVDKPIPASTPVAEISLHWVGPNGGQNVVVPISS